MQKPENRLMGQSLKLRVLAFVFSALVVSCGRPQFLPEDDLIRYIQDPDNKLRVDAQTDNFSLSVTYNPTDLLVAREKKGAYSESSVSELRKRYDSHLYFVLAISKGGNEGVTPTSLGYSQYGEVLQSLSFRMGEFASLTTSEGDVPVEDFLLNRTFGMAKSTDIILVFNRAECEGSDWVQFNLREFGLGTGDQTFRFAMKDINLAPRIFRN